MPQEFATGTLASLTDHVTLALAGGLTGAGGVLSGTYSANVDWWVSTDGGLTWQRALVLWQANSGSSNARVVDSVGSSSAGQFRFLNLGGCTHVRVQLGTYSSGSCAVVLYLTQAGSDHPFNQATEGVAGPQNARLQVVGGLDTAGSPLGRYLRLLAADPVAADYGALVRPIPRVTDWTVTHAPAVNTVAVASKAAGAAGVRHVCTGLSVRARGGTTAPAAVQLTAHLRDGASGAGTILDSFTLVLAAAVGSQDQVELTGLNLPGTAATAMTLEFTAAGGANTFENVNLFGYSTS